MSFIFDKKIQYEDTYDLDAFGRLRVSEITSLLEIKHLYDKQPLLIDEVNSGGSSTFSNSSVQMSVNSGNYVIRQSFRSAIYQPGKSQIFEASFSNFQLETGVIKRVGYFSSTTVAPYNSSFDGFFLESDGTTNQITFQIWRSGTNVLSVNTSNWKTQFYDVSNIDWSKTQLMFCDFQWLGVGRVRFYIVINGEPKLFYEYSAANNDSFVYMTLPSQFIRYEIRSTTGSGSFTQICSQVSMEGSFNSLFKPVVIDNTTERTLSTSGTDYPLIGFRLGANYRASKIIINNSSILQTTNDNFVLTLQKNPTLSASIVWTSLTNTSVEYYLGTGAVSISTPGYVLASYIGKGGSLQNDIFDFIDSALTPGFYINGTPEPHFICIKPLSNNGKFRSVLSINEF
jgi:hypothetical protein